MQNRPLESGPFGGHGIDMQRVDITVEAIEGSLRYRHCFGHTEIGSRALRWIGSLTLGTGAPPIHLHPDKN